MSTTRHFNRNLRFALIVLLYAGLGLNALAPAGYMIAPTGNGWPTVVICPATHPLGSAIANSTDRDMVDHAAMGHVGMDNDDHNSAAGGQAEDCAFSGICKLATESNDVFLISSSLPFARLLSSNPRAPISLRRLAYLRPPLRAPPSLA